MKVNLFLCYSSHFIKKDEKRTKERKKEMFENDFMRVVIIKQSQKIMKNEEKKYEGLREGMC